MKLIVFNTLLDIRKFGTDLITWGEKNFENYPWRKTTDIYEFIIAEVLLHRTNASQVTPVYLKFIKKYPDFESIVNSPASDIHNLLSSLGLTWRVEKFIEMANMIVTQFKGKIPKTRMELLELPGFGNYKAAALMSFYWNLPEPILDTNTIRVFSRIFDIEVNDGLRRNKGFYNEITKIIDKDNPSEFNYALLDLAHKICTVKQPACNHCPLLKTPCRFGRESVSISPRQTIN